MTQCVLNVQKKNLYIFRLRFSIDIIKIEDNDKGILLYMKIQLNFMVTILWCVCIAYSSKKR